MKEEKERRSYVITKIITPLFARRKKAEKSRQRKRKRNEICFQ
jgi:hypothetical protein